jgi:RNA polymerase sigma factor (sigma-70 family)
VVRYQALVCSLAYSATGSLTQSEDLAQETFVTAWKQLSALREPARLRPWLCGIARNLSRQAWRGQQMEPVHQAESLETLATMHAPEAHPLQQAISREEESILWRQLEGIPETYREPLILFYRQHQSTEQVALALELSADTVRQRLVRGRKLLHEQVLAFVEGALEKTSPDAAFTLQVLAALPTVAISAKATAASATIATGGAVAKTAVGTLGLFGGLFAMLGGAFVTAQAQADDTKSLRERKFVFPIVAIQMSALLVLFVGAWLDWQFQVFRSIFVRDALLSAAAFSILFLGILTARYRFLRQRQIQIEENTYDEAEWKSPRKETDRMANSSGRKADTHANKFKRFALSIVLFVVFAFYGPWKQHLVLALVTSVIWPLLATAWLFRSEGNRPRYASGPPSIAVWVVFLGGAFTLLATNLDFYMTRLGADRSKIVSPAEIIVFDAAVILAFGALAGRLIWIRSRLQWLRQRGLPWPGTSGERIGFFKL